MKEILKDQNIVLSGEMFFKVKLQKKDQINTDVLINMLRNQVPAETIAKYVEFPIEKMEQILRQSK